MGDEWKSAAAAAESDIWAWKSVEAAEAEAGSRPGPPSFWEQWARTPEHEREPEIDAAIWGWTHSIEEPGKREGYEDVAGRLREAAHAANELALAIRSARVRALDEQVLRQFTGRTFPPPDTNVKEARERLRKAIEKCRLWTGSWFPVQQLAAKMDNLPEASGSFTISGDDDEGFSRLALNFCRIGELFRYLASRYRRLDGPGRPADVGRRTLIAFARSKGYSLRQLARRLVQLGYRANATRKPARPDDAGAFVNRTGKFVRDEVARGEDGDLVSDREFARLLADWETGQVEAWEARLRSAEGGRASGTRPARKRVR